METLQVTTQAPLQPHLGAFGINDIDEMMIDYPEESEVWNPVGAIVGLDVQAS